MDHLTCKIVGCLIGQRDGVGAFGLWHSLPVPSLEARCHTEGLPVYKSVVFGVLHLTLRLRIAHLVRKSLSFSRQQVNLEMLIWLFIHRSNASFP